MGWGEIIANFRREHGYGENAAKPKKRKKEVGEDLWKHELESHEVLFVQGQDPELHQAPSQVSVRGQASRKANLTDLRGEYQDIELPSRAREVPKFTPSRSPGECKEADKRREEVEARILALRDAQVAKQPKEKTGGR